MTILSLEPLSKQAFAPFGDVIEADGSDWFPINQGSTRRYHRLGLVDVAGDGGLPGISMARGDAHRLPLEIRMLERHPLGSQAFIPCNGVACVVVVAPACAGDRPDESRIRAFLARGDQGVNYHRGTWHHPLTCLERVGDFILLDRIGAGDNCDEVMLSRSYLIKPVGAG